MSYDHLADPGGVTECAAGEVSDDDTDARRERRRQVLMNTLGGSVVNLGWEANHPDPGRITRRLPWRTH
jgi:hypothetical protein